jgi:glycine betaine transporter
LILKGGNMKNISKVFYITIGLIILAVGYGALAPESFEAITTRAKTFVSHNIWLVLHATHVRYGIN